MSVNGKITKEMYAAAKAARIKIAKEGFGSVLGLNFLSSHDPPKVMIVSRQDILKTLDDDQTLEVLKLSTAVAKSLEEAGWEVVS